MGFEFAKEGFFVRGDEGPEFLASKENQGDSGREGRLFLGGGVKGLKI